MDSSKATLRRRLDFSVIYQDHMRHSRRGGCGALPPAIVYVRRLFAVCHLHLACTPLVAQYSSSCSSWRMVHADNAMSSTSL